MDEFFTYSPINRWDDMLSNFENLSADIWEEDNKIFVKMAMPGIKKEDIKITVTGDSISIEGFSKSEKEDKEDKKYYLRNFSSCSYSQRFNLPSLIDSDKVEAEFKDGVLRVQLPKAKETQSKQIEIK